MNSKNALLLLLLLGFSWVLVGCGGTTTNSKDLEQLTQDYFDNLIPLVSLVISGVAFILALLAQQEARRRERSQLYLTLKDRFLDVYKDLEVIIQDDKIDKGPNDTQTAEEKLILLRYWQHSFDEWYTTVRLGEKLERQLWDEYFADAIVSTLRDHPKLRQAFIEVSKNPQVLGPSGEAFCRDVKKRWKEGK